MRIVDTRHFLYGMVLTGQDKDHDYYSENGSEYVCTVQRIDGKREGIAIIEDRDGKMIAKLVYSNDLLHGKCTRYFRDYKLICDVKDNIMHGYFWKYDKSGNVIVQGKFDNGVAQIEGKNYENENSSGQLDNNQYAARCETNNRNSGYPRHKSQEDRLYSPYSTYRQPTDQDSGVTSFLKAGAAVVALGTAVVGLAKLFSSSHDDDR